MPGCRSRDGCRRLLAAMVKPMRQDPRTYFGKKTLIMGDVNSGKTRLTADFIAACCRAQRENDLVILDLAPEPIRGIGGKLPPAPCRPALQLTCPIIAPRLTGLHAEQIQQLAEENARAIEPLLGKARNAGRSILVINDITLYLQAGRLPRVIDLMALHTTCVINAYYGESLPPAPFTGHERAQVLALAKRCHKVVRLG